MLNRLRPYLLLLLIITFARSVFWTESFGVSVDESTYMAVAEAWSHYGTLYVDALDRKPPLTYALYRLVGEIGGLWNLHGIHLTYLLIILALCLIAEKIVRRFFSGITPWLTAFVFALISSSFAREFISCNAEIAMMLPLSLSTWAFLEAARKTNIAEKMTQASFFLFSLAAALAATATLFKQVAAVPFASACMFLGIHFLYKKRFSSLALLCLSTVFGVSFIYGIICFLFYRAGALHELIYWNLTDNLTYIDDSKFLADFSRPTWIPLIGTLGAWPALFVGAFFGLKKKFRNTKYLILLASTGGAFASIYISGRLFAHYFVPFAWYLTVVASPWLSEIWQSQKIVLKRIFLATLLISYFVTFSLTSFRDFTYSIWAPHHPATFSKKTQQDLKEVAEVIEQKSEPCHRLVVWGMASQLYLQSHRGSGTRFIPADYVSGRMGGYSSGVKGPTRDHMKLYLEDFAHKKPELFIDTSTAAFNDYGYFPISDYPELFQEISTNYQKVSEIHGFSLYRRNELKSCSGKN